MISDSQLAHEFWQKGKCSSCPVYDMHGHMGPLNGIYLPNHEPAAMLRSMDAAGVVMLFFSHHSALLAPDVGNRASADAVGL